MGPASPLRRLLVYAAERQLRQLDEINRRTFRECQERAARGVLNFKDERATVQQPSGVERFRDLNSFAFETPERPENG